jgi:hypothetical protein
MDPSIRRYLFNSPLVALDPDGLKVRLTVPNSSQAIDELQALRSEFGVTGDLQVRDVPRLPAQGQQPRLETIDARVINGTYRKGDVSSEILWNLLRDGTDAGDFTSVDQIRQRVSAFKSIIDARDEWNVNFGGEDDTKYWDGNKLKGDVDILTALQVYTFGRQEKVGCQFAVEGMFALGLVNHYQSLYGSLDGLNAAIDRENPIEWLMEQFSQEVTGWDAWHFMPGTIVYIRNPNKYPDPGEGPVLPPIGDKWQGEQGSNTIYIGDGQMSTYGRWHTKSIWKAVGLVYEYKTNTRAKEWCGGVSEFSDLTDKQKMLIRAKLIRTWRIMPRPHFPNFEKR